MPLIVEYLIEVQTTVKITKRNGRPAGDFTLYGENILRTSEKRSLEDAVVDTVKETTRPARLHAAAVATIETERNK